MHRFYLQPHRPDVSVPHQGTDILTNEVLKGQTVVPAGLVRIVQTEQPPSNIRHNSKIRKM